MSSPLTTASDETGIWSPNFAVLGTIPGGSPLIVWGTEGIMGSYIVLSASESQRIENIPIMQGAGFTAILVQLMDGIDVNVEVIDDTNLNPPTFGVLVQILTPFGSIPMVMTKNEANQAPKREGHRSFTFQSFFAINGVH